MKPKHQEILTILAASDHPLTLIDIKNAMEPAQAGKYKGTSEIAGVLSYLQRPLGYVASNKYPSYDNGKATFEWSITDAGKAALSAAFKTHLPHTSETDPQPVDPAPSAETNLTNGVSIMTTQLIPVFSGELSGNPVQLVDARLLHSFLEVARDFSHWIKDRIEEYGFIENVDFLLAKFSEQKRRGGHNKIDYHITLDMAKELSMVERNEKGKQARRYSSTAKPSPKAPQNRSKQRKRYRHRRKSRSTAP